MTLGAASAFAGDKKGKKDDLGRVPKGMSEITVTTSEESYPVKIDGEYQGMSGVDSPARFTVDPDKTHTVEIEGPNGLQKIGDYYVIKGERKCICLKTVTTPHYKDCPYDVYVDRSAEEVDEGQSITFTARNRLGESPVPLVLKWGVSAGTITSGIGTSAITVDTANTGGQTINVDLDVNDNEYGNQCHQTTNADTHVRPKETPPDKVKCDEVIYKSHDDDKARLDNCMVMAQNSPYSHLYLIIYPGSSKGSQSYDSLANRARQYLISVRGFDPSRIEIVRGPSRSKTTYEMYIVPPGAQPPVPY